GGDGRRGARDASGAAVAVRRLGGVAAWRARTWRVGAPARVLAQAARWRPAAARRGRPSPAAGAELPRSHAYVHAAGRAGGPAEEREPRRARQPVHDAPR